MTLIIKQHSLNTLKSTKKQMSFATLFFSAFLIVKKHVLQHKITGLFFGCKILTKCKAMKHTLQPYTVDYSNVKSQ